MAIFNYSEYKTLEKTEGFGSGSSIGYFSLPDDGDEAVVRFQYSTPEEFGIVTTHSVQIDGKYRRVHCLRENGMEAIDNCPLCASKNRVQPRFYIKLIEYIRDDKQNIIGVPKIWERPANFAKILVGYIEEGYILKDCIFKVKRRGKKGDLKTTYEVIYGNPNIYVSDMYPKNDEAFKDYSLEDYAVLDKSFEELTAYVNGAPLTATSAQSNQGATAPQSQGYNAPQNNQPYPQNNQPYPQNNQPYPQNNQPNYNQPSNTPQADLRSPQARNNQQPSSTPAARPGRRYNY